MPPVIAWVAAILVSVGFSAAVAAWLATLIVNGIIMFAATKLLAKKPNLGNFMEDVQNRTQMVRQSISPRRICYGKARLSGTMAYMVETGPSRQYLHIIVLMASHKCEEVGDVYLNDELLSLDGSGNETGNYAGFVRVKKYLGSDTQAADTDLIAESGGQWTSAHQLKGNSYLYVRCVFSNQKFPGGLPTFSAIVKGKKVLDPRDGTTSWTDNAARCIYDLFRDVRYSLGVPIAEVHQPTIINSCNVSDEDVLLADGVSTEKRYTLNGTYTTDTKAGDVIGGMLSAMAGQAIYAGGLWYIYAGAYQTPTITLDESDLRGSIVVATKQSRRDTFNRVKGTYVSEADNWQATDFPPITNAFYLAEDGGEELWTDLQLPFTVTASMAQRLAKIDLERMRQQIQVRMQCKLTALRVQAGQTVLLNNARWGFANKPFEINNFQFVAYQDPKGNMAIGVDLVLRETAAAVWDWNHGEETTVDLSPNTNLPDPFDVHAPIGLALTSGSPTVIIQPDGTVVPRLLATWGSPADQYVVAGGYYELEYKKTLDSDWIAWSRPPGDVLLDYITDVKIGVRYDVRIRSKNVLNVFSAWQSVINFLVAGDTTAPAPPSGVTISATPGIITTAWTANTEPDFNEYTVYRNTVNNFSTATKIAQTGTNRFTDTVGLAPGTRYYYWITASDNSENESGPSAEVDVIAVASSGSAGLPGTPTAPTLTTSNHYQSNDGTTFGLLTFSIAGLPVNAVGQNVLYRPHSGSTEYQIAAQLTNTGTTSLTIDDLIPGRSYDVAVAAFNADGVLSAITSATGGPFTVPGDTTAPATPTGLAAVAGTGHIIALAWNKNTEGDFEEYEVYRSTTNTFGTATLIANTRGNSYVDTAVTFGVPYYYWITASDQSENESAPTASVNATANAVPDGQVDQTAPTAPVAAHLVDDGVYNSGDGTTFSYLDMYIPALVGGSGQKYINVIYRRLGATEWLIGSQISQSSDQVVRLDDLTPDIIYEVATVAYSAFGVPSSVTAATGSPFTAPTKSTGPSAPQTVVLSAPSPTISIPPAYLGGSYVLFASKATWEPPVDNDVLEYEWKAVFTNSDSDTGYTWGHGFTRELFAYLYNAVLNPGYFFVRAKNRSGVWGAWAAGGNANGAAGLPVGSIAVYNNDAVRSSGLQIGDVGASSPTQLQAVYNESVVEMFPGTSNVEYVNIDLSGRGFNYKPTVGNVSCATNSNLKGDYDFDNAGNSSTNAVLRIYSLDGSIFGGGERFSVYLAQT